MGSITKVMSVEVENVPWRFCPFFTFGILGRRVGRIAANFYPQLLKSKFLQPVCLLHIVTQLVEMRACLLPCSGWPTNVLSHAAFMQARPNGPKIMAPRWRHGRAKKFPMRVSETKQVKITLACFKSLTAADLSLKDEFDQVFNFQGPVISECTYSNAVQLSCSRSNIVNYMCEFCFRGLQILSNPFRAHFPYKLQSQGNIASLWSVRIQYCSCLYRSSRGHVHWVTWSNLCCVQVLRQWT